MNHFGYHVFCLDQFSRRSPNLSALYGTQKRYDSNGPASIFFFWLRLFHGSWRSCGRSECIWNLW